MPMQEPPTAANPLAEPGLRRVLVDYVKRRVPASDVDDVVQTILLDALASETRPADAEELRKWLLGIARHKVVDHHRRVTREPAAELPELEASPPPVEERAMARWAEQQVASQRDAQQTLAWMAREGEGEKLESIAADERVPAARVRQRVSRMRRWMKERWMAELAAVATLALVALVAWRLLRRDPREMPQALPEAPKAVPSLAPEDPSPLDRARALRADALRKCDQREWQGCVDGLDEAARLDPAGDTAPEVVEARARARGELQAPPAPSSSAPPAPLTPRLSPTPTAPVPPPVPTGPTEKMAPKPTAPSPLTNPSKGNVTPSDAPTSPFSVKKKPSATKPTLSDF